MMFDKSGKKRGKRKYGRTSMRKMKREEIEKKKKDLIK